MEEDNAGKPIQAYRGNSGFSINTELEFDNIIQLKRARKLKSHFDFDSYLFVDAGVLSYINTDKKSQWSSWRADAGVGASFTIKRWFKLYNTKPLTIRFDIPFVVSNAPAGENNVAFRWVLGFNRAF